MENSLSRMRPHLVSEWSEKNFPMTPDMQATAAAQVLRSVTAAVVEMLREADPVLWLPLA